MDDVAQIAAALATVRAPLFLARQSTRGAGLILHTAERGAAGKVQAGAVAALAAAALPTDCRVTTHNPRGLARARSLEAIARKFQGGAIVFDPTGIVGRTEAMVAFARQLRQTRSEVQRLYIDAARRTLFVIVDRAQFPEDGAQLLQARAATLAAVTTSFAEWRAASLPDFDLAVRIGFEPPNDTSLIAIDARTVAETIRSLFRGRFGRAAIKAAMASAIGLAVTVPASAAGPAVSQPNISFLTRGAWLNPDPGSFAAVGVKATVPLLTNFGAQVDVAAGTDHYGGLGVHLFARDPSRGLIGAFGSTETRNGVDLNRVGGQAELYLPSWTLAATAGQQSGDVTKGFFGKLDITFYAGQNFSLTGGVKTDPYGTFGHAGFNWQPAFSAMPAMSIFADGQFGDPLHQRFMAGLDFHFGGQPRTLKDRDRRDDPFFSLFNVPIPTVGYVAAPQAAPS